MITQVFHSVSPAELVEAQYRHQKDTPLDTNRF